MTIPRRLSRKTIYSSNFLNLYEDKLELSNGKIIEDYTIVELFDGVMIVASDKEKNLIMIKEFKHGINEADLTLPAGTLDKKGENIMSAAQRELIEETGYTSNNWEQIGFVYYHTAKSPNKLYIVRAKDCQLTHSTEFDETEQIELQKMNPEKVKELISSGNIHSSSTISALALTGLLK